MFVTSFWSSASISCRSRNKDVLSIGRATIATMNSALVLEREVKGARDEQHFSLYHTSERSLAPLPQKVELQPLTKRDKTPMCLKKGVQRLDIPQKTFVSTRSRCSFRFRCQKVSFERVAQQLAECSFKCCCHCCCC